MGHFAGVAPRDIGAATTELDRKKEPYKGPYIVLARASFQSLVKFGVFFFNYDKKSEV